jgi:raffinose/stachyose/melibiose transport system substrate-binding protein
MVRSRSSWRTGFAGAALSVVMVALGVGAAEARSETKGDTVTIGLLAIVNSKPGYDVLIPNFERVYPNIRVNVTYVANNTDLYQLERTELAAGNAPELLGVSPGCGTPISVCTLAPAGYLVPLVKQPWVKWSVPLVTSADKYGSGLFAFSPQISPYGIFTNDDLFRKLGLKVPKTVTQLLDLCRRANAAGTAPIIVAGASGAFVAGLITVMAVATVYGQDKQWAAALKAGKVTFDGSPGWHQALQQFIDMNSAGCFQPGFTGVPSGTVAAGQFAQGQGLVYPNTSNNKAVLDAASPQFSYSFHPFPGGTSANQATTFLSINAAVGINAHSGAQNQAAAQTFVDFIARPKQNALFARVQGSLTQYEFLKGQIPDFMPDFATVFEERDYVMNPPQSWWNPNVLLTLQQNGIGLITGQRSIDDVLKAMDAAWQQGPAQ